MGRFNVLWLGPNGRPLLAFDIAGKEIRPGADRFTNQIFRDSGNWGERLALAGGRSRCSFPAAPETYVQAVTNCVRIYTGGGKIRNAQSAAYFLQWIEKLRAMTEDLHHWRTAAEK